MLALDYIQHNTGVPTGAAPVLAFMQRYRRVNATLTDQAHGGVVDGAQDTVDGLGERLVLVVGAEVAYAVLVDLVTRAPPAFATTVAFGIALAIGLGWQARRSAV